MKPGATTRENRPSHLLSREENESVFSLFGPRCESLATTVVQIFVTTAPEHCEWSKLDAGVLCLVKDHIKRSYYFRIYCPERRILVWEQEIYTCIQYVAPKPFLHSFEAQDCIVAFNFASVEEANWFRNIFIDKMESRKQKREKRTRNSIHSYEPPGSKHTPYIANGLVSGVNKTPASLSSNIPASIGSGLFYKSKDEKKKNKKKDGKKTNITKAAIGTPYGFRHISHVGWDINKGFDANLANDENPELKAFFEKAGVSETQLKDQATRDFIYDFIQHNGGIDRAVNEVSQEAVSGSTQKDNSYGSRHVASHERNGPHAPPPLPVRNPLISNRAAPPPPPLSVPAPPPPNQAPPPPPPPPLRVLPNHQQTTAGSGPPPPPPPMPPAAPPLPMATAVNDSQQTSQQTTQPPMDTHSALMESIRSGKTLRKIDVDCESKNSSDSRDDLLTQIRQGFQLRPVQPVAKQPSGPPENSLADALARALAERSRFIHSDSSSSGEDDDDDDDEWED